MYACMYVCMYVCMHYVCMYVSMYYACMCVCMYVLCVYVCMYACMYACVHACKNIELCIEAILRANATSDTFILILILWLHNVNKELVVNFLSHHRKQPFIWISCSSVCLLIQASKPLDRFFNRKNLNILLNFFWQFQFLAILIHYETLFTTRTWKQKTLLC